MFLHIIYSYKALTQKKYKIENSFEKTIWMDLNLFSPKPSEKTFPEHQVFLSHL